MYNRDSIIDGRLEWLGSTFLYHLAVCVPVLTCLLWIKIFQRVYLLTGHSLNLCILDDIYIYLSLLHNHQWNISSHTHMLKKNLTFQK